MQRWPFCDLWPPDLGFGRHSVSHSRDDVACCVVQQDRRWSLIMGRGLCFEVTETEVTDVFEFSRCLCLWSIN